MKPIVLASASPRRRVLLEHLQIPFTVYPVEIDENFSSLPPEEDARRLAREKIEALLCKAPETASKWILGADTIVVSGEEKIGKPASLEEAERILTCLSGEQHQVITGIALYAPDKAGSIITAHAVTVIRFKHLDATERAWYLSTGEWQGAAGGYRIQERGGFFVESISGSYSNVMGLPIHTFYGMLRSSNYPLFS